jgi:outer membrane protein OmpA-like peptidoglycan-associated protein
MKKVQIIISAILLTTFMACHETDKKDNITNDADTAVVKQDDEISSKEKQATNWNELDWNSPVIKYDEVKSKDVSVRGNDNYAIYSVEEKVLFNSGQSTIRKQAEQNLNEIASAITSHSKGDIRVYGYTDSTDTKESNKELSQKRAEEVRNYLISKGNIPDNRISVYAEGEANPVATNSTSQGRQQNRRVEIVAMN